MPPSTFDELLDAARGQQPAALTELWRRYSPMVAAYARARGSAEVDELVSEVFLAVFRALDSFRGGEAGFKGLVFTIARRRLVDEQRRRSRRVDTEPLPENYEHELAPSAEEHVLAEHGARLARAWLEELSPDQRDVLMLRIFGDLTVEQVARVVGKRVGAVKALQRRGLEALRRRIATTEGQAPDNELLLPALETLRPAAEGTA
jgi:RNA polymerase sigma-70 factor (ECF subfamily)